MCSQALAHVDVDVNDRGRDGARALHAAAAAGAPELVFWLLRLGADPVLRDDRGRTPYVLAPDRKTRDAFIKARNHLGEDANDWAAGSIPEPLDDAAVKAKKAKEAEKKKRQRERQKQAKKDNVDKARLAEDARQAQVAYCSARKALDDIAKSCAACAGVVRGSPFTRLDYTYCSSKCVQDHRRKLMADAAEARFKKK